MNVIIVMFWIELNYGALFEPHVVAAYWQDGAIDQIKVLTNLLHSEFCENNFILNSKKFEARSRSD